MPTFDHMLTESWIVLPPGNKAILRFPAPELLPGWRQATAEEFMVANLGYPFPWGRSRDVSKASCS